MSYAYLRQFIFVWKKLKKHGTKQRAPSTSYPLSIKLYTVIHCLPYYTLIPFHPKNMSTKRTVLTIKQNQQVQVPITRTPYIKLAQIQGWVRERLGLRISTTATERILQAPDNALLAMGRKRNRNVLFTAFEAAVLAYYRLNDGKAIVIDELLPE